MLGTCSRQRHHPLSLIRWYASGNEKNTVMIMVMVKIELMLKIMIKNKIYAGCFKQNLRSPSVSQQSTEENQAY